MYWIHLHDKILLIWLHDIIGNFNLHLHICYLKLKTKINKKNYYSCQIYEDPEMNIHCYKYTL
jgi:hypothetical protein